MDTIEAIILGVVQGLAEFLPISSSGHLILVSYFLDGEALPLYLNVALHIGTLLAVLIFFWRDWWQLASGIGRTMTGRKDPEACQLLTALLIGSIPAGIIGLTLKDQIEQYLHGPFVVCGPLAVFGILMWWYDRKLPSHRRMTALSAKHAFFVGLFQALALIPGTSRSGATILGGRLTGLDRSEAARFSFLLGTPAMLGAALLEMEGMIAGMAEPGFFLGVFVSFLTGLFAISFFLKFFKRYGFGGFAIYRLLLALCIVGFTLAFGGGV